jgi:peptidoglycan/LPS O-acetylase OafA/YrhL
MKNILWLAFLIFGLSVFVETQLPACNSVLNMGLSKNWIIWLIGAQMAESFTNGQRFILNKHWLIKFCIIGLGIGCLFFQNNALVIHFTTSLVCALVFEWYLFSGNTSWSLAEKLLHELGLISYSVYLIHQPLLDMLLKSFTIRFLPTHSFIAGSLSVLASFGFIFCLSKGYHAYIEAKSIEYGKRWLSKILYEYSSILR